MAKNGETFEAFVSRERERLNNARQDALARRKEVDRELAGIEREMEAISAYEQVKSGKAARGGSRGPRGPREGGKRDELLKLIAKDGPLSRGEILAKLGVKGDKSGEQSVSNALTNLKKAGKLSAKDGKYKAA